MLLRFPHRGQLWHNLWAEDGFQFLKCRLAHGPSCVGTSYQGYLQLAPRILIQVVPYFPATYWAFVTALLAVGADALALTLVYRSTAWLIPPRAVRAALVLVIAGAAATHWEVAGNLANLHWFLLLSGIFVAADQSASDSPRWISGRTAWLVIVCLSEALAPIVAAAYLVGLFLRRQRRGSWLRADIVGGVVVGAAAAGQFINSEVNQRVYPKGPNQTLADVGHYYQKWVLDWGWAGQTDHSRTFSRIFFVGVGILLAAGLVLLTVRRGWSATRWLPIAAGVVIAIGSIGNLGLSVILNHGVVPRYIFLPFALILTAIGVVLYRLYERFRFANLAGGVLAAAVVAGVLVLGPYPPRVATQGPSWRTQIAAAQYQCRTEPAGAVHKITIAPYLYHVALTCRRIGG